jgi:hypothetical protein
LPPHLPTVDSLGSDVRLVGKIVLQFFGVWSFMNFEALIADLMDKIDQRQESADLSGNKRRYSRSLALSEARGSSQLQVDSGSLKQRLALDVDYKDLAVSLRSEQSMAAEVCGLKGQLVTLAEYLAQANDKLDQANRKIGFLEAQILIQDEQIRQLKNPRGERTITGKSAKGRKAKKA